MTGKGILKYLAYVFIGGWMFLLGIMVGRGSAPVSFDTSGFQQRLASIVEDRAQETSAPVELGFYDALDSPKDPDVLEVRVKPRKKNLLGKQKMETTPAPEPEETKTSPLPETPSTPPSAAKKTAITFTIQIASFKEKKDATTCISQLQKKGIPAGMEPTLIDGQTWHRVRTGSFTSHEMAKKRLAELKKNRLDGFIIQTKDSKK